MEQLYKVLVDGQSSHGGKLSWSLPTQSPDGSWTPGDWHEVEVDTGKLDPCRLGLHLTADPLDWMLYGGRIFAAEADSVVEVSEAPHKVITRRARLLWPAADAELDRLRVAHEEREKARAERSRIEAAEAEKRRQREHLDRAREIAADGRRNAEAAKAAGVESPALFAFRTLVELTPAESWRDVDSSRYAALAHATRWLRFDPSDIEIIYKDYRGGYWFGSDGPEHLYAAAVAAGNASACVAWEKYLGRKPWWREGQNGKRVRVAVGDDVYVNGAWHRVTSFRDTHLNAVRDGDKKVVKLAREQLLPRAKKTTGEAVQPC